MKCLDFDWQINEFMVYCRSTQLREKSMAGYEQALRLFERWCAEELRIFTVDKVTEPVIRRYINDLQERGKYTFYVNDQSKKKNFHEILNSMDVPWTNGFIEGCNIKTKVLKRVCFGMRNFSNFRKRILFCNA